MNIDNILKNLIIENLEIPYEMNSINDNTSFFDELSMDSLSFVKLMIKIERKFNIKFDDEEMDLPVIGNYFELKKYLLDILNEDLGSSR